MPDLRLHEIAEGDHRILKPFNRRVRTCGGLTAPAPPTLVNERRWGGLSGE
ncbi:hypothetical protein [Actinomadura flavalba]|uniref:hypothetical protein n=1 Tax=Actinomadura flavalba TaxID=1120938 RepID=UPI00039E8942|nr:hypothetical protein [Actinomadura flavalba]